MDLFPEALLVARHGLRTAVHDCQAGLPRRATAAALGKSVQAVTYRRSQARGCGLLPAIASRRAGGVA